MSNNKNVNKSKKGIAIFSAIAALGLIVVLIVIFNGNNKGEDKTGSSVSSVAADLVIPKAEVTETAKFYPVKAGDTSMEVLAVKASDGSVRTAFNTCQVCNGSPKAYYKQQGDVLVCQNCGNRFKMDMVEQQRGGCNPVPIMKDEKKDDGANITIPKDLIEKNKVLFTSNWKTQ